MLLLSALVFSLQTHVGYGSGQLDWNIGSDSSNAMSPNILSELNFDNLRTSQAGFNANISFAAPVDSFRVILEGGFNLGSIENGQVTDSDFSENNRNGLYSKSQSHVTGKGIREYNVGIGLQYSFYPNQFIPFAQTIAVIYGGQQQEQALNLQRGQQLLAVPQFFPASTSIDSLNQRLAGLDSDYSSKWSSQWLAAEYKVLMSDWTLSVRYQYFLGVYQGEGRWNLREDYQQPKSFVHDANSSGQQIELGLAYRFSEKVQAQLNWMSGNWETEDGVSKTYFVDNTVQVIRFNEASWSSSTFRLGVNYSF